MSYTLSIIPGSDIALYHWKGPITFDDRVRMLQILTDYCSDNAVHKLIVDGRDQESRTSMVESFQFGEEVPKALRGLRVAVVHREDDESLRFIETVAANRGSMTRPFLSVDAARAWLEGHG